MSINQKKTLVDLIKTELKKEISEIENIPIGNHAPICGVSKVAWGVSGNTGIWILSNKLREMADQLFPEANQPKGFNEGELTASNIGQKDFDEIISLIQQVNNLRKAENQRRKQKKEEKLSTNPNLFFYICKGTSGKPGEGMYRLFEGRKDGKNFLLNIPVTHSDLTNIPFAGQESNDNKVNHFYLINGFEMPTETKYHAYTDTYFYEKSIKLTDPISVVPCQENESRVSRLVKLESLDYDQKDSSNWDLFWFMFVSSEGEKFEVNSQNISLWQRTAIRKSGPNKGDKDYWYKISWKEAEKDKRRFEKGDFIEIEEWNDNVSDNPQSPKNLGNIWEKEWENEDKNKTAKDVHISTLIEWFKSRNIKSIQVMDPTWSLLVTYNDGKNEILNNENQKIGMILNCLRYVDEKNLDQQKLEKLKNNSHSHENSSEKNQPKPSYVPYLIGGGIIIGTLGLGWIVYRLRNQKEKK